MNPASIRFWRLFREQVAPLGVRFEAGPRRVFDAVEQALAESGLDFAFDVTATEEGLLLLFSPEGDEEVAREIDALVGATPELPGWKVLGRRQPKPWQDALALVGEIAEASLADARFAVARGSEGLRVEVVAEALADFEDDSANRLAMLLLHHMLGEEYVMSAVRQMEGRSQETPGLRYLTPPELVAALTGGRTA